MKFLLSMSLIVSVFMYADDHIDEKPMYEANVAEYYFSTFKDGKDMDDMMRWAEKWEKWATTGDAADANADYRASMLIPYYGESLDQLDFVWLGINTNPEMQAIGNDYWVQNGGKLLEELPVTNAQVVNTWQRTVSETPDGTAGYVVYSDCKYGEGVTGEQQYDAWFAFAQAAKKLGDVAGTMIMFKLYILLQLQIGVKIGQIFGALIMTSQNMMLWQQWAVFVKTQDHSLLFL